MGPLQNPLRPDSCGSILPSHPVPVEFKSQILRDGLGQCQNENQQMS